MAYNLWFSEKYADQNAGTEVKEDWMGNPAWTDQGYSIAADKDGTLHQFMDANDKSESALQGYDRHAYITTSAQHQDDFRILINRKGEINEDLAAELDIKADLATIRSLTANFYDPQPGQNAFAKQVSKAKTSIAEQDQKAISRALSIRPGQH